MCHFGCHPYCGSLPPSLPTVGTIFVVLFSLFSSIFLLPSSLSSYHLLRANKGSPMQPNSTHKSLFCYLNQLNFNSLTSIQSLHLLFHFINCHPTLQVSTFHSISSFSILYPNLTFFYSTQGPNSFLPHKKASPHHTLPHSIHTSLPFLNTFSLISKLFIFIFKLTLSSK